MLPLQELRNQIDAALHKTRGRERITLTHVGSVCIDLEGNSRRPYLQIRAQSEKYFKRIARSLRKLGLLIEDPYRHKVIEPQKKKKK